MRVLQVGGFDVLGELAEFDTAVVLIARAVAIRDLDKEPQLAISTTGLQVPAIQLDFDSRNEPLMKREFGAGDGRSPVEVCRASFTEPLIKGDLIKSRVNRATLVGSLGSHKGGSEEEENKTADQSTFYSRQRRDESV